MKTILILNFLLFLVNCQQIVRFNGYFDEFKRKEILKEASLFSHISRSEKRATKYSDFELINESLFFDHPLIRDINFYNSSNVLHLNADSLTRRRRPELDIPNVAQKVQADILSAKTNVSGNGIKIAIFDTGLTKKRMHFRNVLVERDYTDESFSHDRVGHGTFVAGVIAGTNRRCPGVAPDAQLYIYKVFAKNQESRTSWFLDAFNDAIQHGVDIINLSIGGTDYKDKVFMDKVEEVISRGIIFVSAVGNDGPEFGSINNPADHSAVIGVGAVNAMSKLATFSSRGPTTLEFPEGYGRIKPDILTFGVQLKAAALNGGCKFMSGTSVATPLVTGSIALLLSSMPKEKRNSMHIHQILKSGAERLPNVSLFEQGAGRMELLSSYMALKSYEPQITLFPSKLDTKDCPFSWPYCSQPLYANSLPMILNLTIYNGHNSTMRIKQITFEYDEDQNGTLLDIAVEHNTLIDKYGYLSVFLQLNKMASNYNGFIEGQLNVECESKYEKANVLFPIRVEVIKTPLKSRRILWDQFRNLNYPLGFIPRDDLRAKPPLDWQIDHPHTNFQKLYNELRSNAYFIEVSGRPLTCLDLSNYGHLLIVDPEDEYFIEEMTQIQNAVQNGLNLIVLAEWYNKDLLEKMNFEEPDTKQKQIYPETGGANIPALNDLLNPFGFAFGDQVLEGKAKLFNEEFKISSGAQIKAAPSTAWISTANLNDIVPETLNKTKTLIENATIFAMNWQSNFSGFVALFGDSNCFESNECTLVLIKLLNLTQNSFDPNKLNLKQSTLKHLPLNDLPVRLTKSNFASISRVVAKVYKSYVTYKRLPYCSIREFVSFNKTQLIVNFNESKDQLRMETREYFKNTNLTMVNISNDDDPIYADYQENEDDAENRAKLIEQFYTYRFLYFISVFLLISFIWYKIIPSHRFKSLICKPLMRLIRVFL